ncbi:MULTISPECIES: alpha-xylosidase [unclassified Nocardioides]|uniref:alpha-xylosidase n=1 Tax=unclassified Nocardioides TaxID=2615069 RepID=UPI0009F13D23|nr:MULTISPECIES: alpha-xylosidase [unclassified Nocardioides]GAW50132.1 alpha-xylosidase [Nocardioides sp. PD653-B2]GAW54817.1 alpha-xylosidase [Nocardioides sp. PD653]
MKFTAGFWYARPGVQIVYPVQVHDVEADGESLTVFGVTRRVTTRGDTLNQPTLTATYSSPMLDVIRVSLRHFEARSPLAPRFELAAETGPAPDITLDDAGTASLRSGNLEVVVRPGEDWGVEFRDAARGRVLSSSGAKGAAYVETDGGQRYVREQLDLAPDEYVYGLGERFGPLVKNGQVVDIWNEDGGTSSEQAYKNIPFYLTNRGYGVFVDHPELVSFEVGSEVVSRVQFSVEGERLDYFVIYGPTPAEILDKYTALTGRPALPPAWSYGLWLSTSFTTSYDEATVTGFIDEMSARDLPMSVMHFDCFWMREFHWCDFEWDPRTFPEPAAMLSRLKARGLRITVWINPYVAQRSALFEEGRERGYFVKNLEGEVWQTDVWQPGMAVVDFTNEAAREWFSSKLRRLLDMGVDGFKTDFGERIPVDAVFSDGSDPHRMHNYYTYLYNKTVFTTIEEAKGRGSAVVFARSATAGGQQFPVHWGGDCTPQFSSMAESLRGGLSLGLSGFGFWSHDIGGFEGTPDPAVFKRWVAFGLLSSHSRLHGSDSYRVPWEYDEEAVDVLRSFTKLKLRLMPYLTQLGATAHERGLPVMRAMVLEFPSDPAVTHLDRQYMLGDALLVAPVFSAEGGVTYYAPAGVWTHLISGRCVVGPGWFEETHGYDSLPLLVRPNTVLPLGARDDRPDYDYADGVRLAVFELADGAEIETVLRTVDGARGTVFTTSRAGTTIRVTTAEPPDRWQVLLVGHTRSAQVDGGTDAGVSTGPTAPGSLIEVNPGARELVITLIADESAP